jgi:hypothetical protein
MPLVTGLTMHSATHLDDASLLQQALGYRPNNNCTARHHHHRTQLQLWCVRVQVVGFSKVFGLRDVLVATGASVLIS